ncbi:MAG: peroxiredoxin [Bacteroidetes bacterium]|nr:peroxiredoxin [Bacteroidota bacterium]
MALDAGKKAPNFKAFTDTGDEIEFSKLSGKWVVLYFYPKDNTSGCTKEACDFRDNLKRITSTGAVVLGVSPDSVKSHDGFKDKYNLNFNLVSDSDKSICKTYDVLGEKSMYGKKYIGVIRTTYIIDDKGVIKYVDPKVSVDGHVDDIIDKLKELKKK